MTIFKYVGAVILGAATYFIFSAVTVRMLMDVFEMPERDAMIFAYLILGAGSGAAIAGIIHNIRRSWE